MIVENGPLKKNPEQQKKKNKKATCGVHSMHSDVFSPQTQN